MKRFYTLIIVLLTATVIFGGAILERFTAKSSNEKVVIEWKTKEETSVKTFVLERKSVNSEFIPITEIQPKGNYSSYSYTDETAYKTSANLYSYRLKIVDNDGVTSYSAEVSVFHSVSSVKRTWGSIKAMFR